MIYLRKLENKSIYIIREAFCKFKNVALLWSVGKDSTTLLWLCYKAFHGKIPFPVIHIDTGYKFKEIYEFRDQLAKQLGLDLIIGKNQERLDAGMGPDKGLKFDCCNELKTDALKAVIDKYRINALFLGIRRDEHEIRAKERYFSPRDESFKWNYEEQPAELWDQYSSKIDDGHFRVHPLLHMTELDIWKYIRAEDLPIIDLYFSNNGRRHRSIGCHPCCSPVESEARTVDDIIEELESTKIKERSGRAQDKEDMYTMQKLRSLGYM